MNTSHVLAVTPPKTPDSQIPTTRPDSDAINAYFEEKLGAKAWEIHEEAIPAEQAAASPANEQEISAQDRTNLKLLQHATISMNRQLEQVRHQDPRNRRARWGILPRFVPDA